MSPCRRHFKQSRYRLLVPTNAEGESVTGRNPSIPYPERSREPPERSMGIGGLETPARALWIGSDVSGDIQPRAEDGRGVGGGRDDPNAEPKQDTKLPVRSAWPGPSDQTQAGLGVEPPISHPGVFRTRYRRREAFTSL
jgi:hypothetical protein